MNVMDQPARATGAAENAARLLEDAARAARAAARALARAPRPAKDRALMAAAAAL